MSIPNLPHWLGAVRCRCHDDRFKAIIIRRGKVAYESDACYRTIYDALKRARAFKVFSLDMQKARRA